MAELSREEKVELFLDMVEKSDNIVFFGGAGVSTESGIPDFRSVDGLYNQEYDYPPETILSHTFYRRNTEEFYRFYRNKMLCLTAQPNMAHKKLAELEAAGKVRAVVTQNIMMPGLCCIAQGFRTVRNAAEKSSPMWCFMRRGLIIGPYRKQFIISAMQIC